MRRRDLSRVILVVSMATLATGCASGGARPEVGAAPTTVIVVRHAEQVTGQGEDPSLSETGMARARALARALTDADVTGVVVTSFARTAETAAPTAEAAGVTPEVVRVQRDRDWLQRHLAEISAAVRRHAGGVVLVVGHSNTVSDIVAALGAGRPREICDSEYDRMEIVSMLPNGHVRRIRSRYGAPTPVDAECAVLQATRSAEYAFTREDSVAVANADLAYADGWLAGGAEPVMTTLHEDAVIVPSGMDPLEGAQEIRGWWFAPDSPPTKVHRYDLDQEEIGGSGTLAFVRGSFELAFEYDGEEYESGGTYLSLLRPDDEGNWRISHRMWSDR